MSYLSDRREAKQVCVQKFHILCSVATELSTSENFAIWPGSTLVITAAYRSAFTFADGKIS
ncbi:MAG: hypothetical protein ACPGVP_15910, partial [Thiolinea sp.]